MASSLRPRKLKFEGLPPVIGKSKLALLKAIYTFFNNKVKTFWLVEDIIFSEEKSDAVVIFKKVEDAEDIIKRGDTVTMFDTTVKVIPFHEEVESDSEKSVTNSTKKVTTPAAEEPNLSYENSLAHTTETKPKCVTGAVLHTSKNKMVDGIVQSAEKKRDQISRKESLRTPCASSQKENDKGAKSSKKVDINKLLNKGTECEFKVSEEVLVNITEAKSVLNVNLSYFGIQEFLQHSEGKQMIKEVEDKNGCLIKPEIKPGFSCRSGWDFGNIRLTFIEDEINKQKTDVIVNSVSSSLDLEAGKLTPAILKEAGDQIQTELKTRYSKGIGLGDFAVSSGGNMLCKYIFHAAMWTYTKENIKNMKNLIKKLLEGAENFKAESISFPALGTGNLTFPPEITAQVMLEMIAEYSKNNPSSVVKLVNIVVFPQDHIVSKAFKTVLFSRTNGITDGLPDNCDDIDEVYNFGNVCFKIKLGDLTKERTDVIVSGVKNTMDLCKSGKVCGSLLKTCGLELQDECLTKKAEIVQQGFVLTSAPKLPCKNIIFLSQDKFSNCWDKGILMVLMEAEKIGVTSLAIPALGAELHVTDLLNVKKLIFEAVEQFSRMGNQKLTEINLVIYDSGIIHHFLQEQHKTVISIEKNILSKRTSSGSISQNVNIKIYSDDEAMRNKAANQLKEKCLSAYKKYHITYNVSLQQLGAGEIQKLIDLGIQLNVKITFNTEQNSADFEGFQTESILQLQTQVMETVMNVFFDWQYKKGKIWKSFGPLLSHELERKHKTGSFYEWTDFRGRRYKIDYFLMKMIPLDKTSKKSKDVRRIKDNKTEQVQICCNNITAKSFQLPSNWDAMSDTENLKIVGITKGSPEYMEVENHFKLKFAIKKIERIQNKSLYQQYFVKKEELDLLNPAGHNNEEKLFHGTAKENIKQINENGFNRSYCGVNGTSYGKGVYFAAAPQYSSSYSKPDDQGNRYMYRARVLTGEFTATNEDTNFLPNKPGTNRPYDSGGDLKKGIYVIFHDSQAYPEYLITF
ncbi:hypothetical protein Btru_048699 [Bulinus truncatus]|nr:hypothetical protein Btru_048699 [Bulinus truncatus]